MPWPFVHAPLRLNLFLSNFHTIFPASVFVWFYCTFWLVFLSCGVKDVWTFRLRFLAFYPFFRLGVAWAKALIFLRSLCFPFLCQWASWLLILPYHFIVLVIVLPSLRVTLWTCGLTFLPCQPTSLSIFCLGLPRPTSHIYTSFGLCWPTFLPCQPYFIISFLRLPRPIYFLFTSFTPMGFLLDLLGFLGPITTSLPLITFWAYCALSQPNEFTNSFPGLAQPIYFFITSYYFYELTT